MRIFKLFLLVPLVLLTACPQDEQCEAACRSEFPFSPIDQCECDAFGNPYLRSTAVSSVTPRSTLTISGVTNGRVHAPLQLTSTTCPLAPERIAAKIRSKNGRGHAKVSGSSSLQGRTYKQAVARRGNMLRGRGRGPLEQYGCASTTSLTVLQSTAAPSGIRLKSKGDVSFVEALVKVSCRNGFRCEATYQSGR